jgi:hypothetical protein
MTSDDGNDSLDDVINNLTSEKFQKASPSLFDDSSVFQKDSERSSSSDFMAHQVGTLTTNQIENQYYFRINKLSNCVILVLSLTLTLSFTNLFIV